jgi:hypothetical protein
VVAAVDTTLMQQDAMGGPLHCLSVVQRIENSSGDEATPPATAAAARTKRSARRARSTPDSPHADSSNEQATAATSGCVADDGHALNTSTLSTVVYAHSPGG